MTSERGENSSFHNVSELLMLPSVALEERRSLPTRGGVYFVYLATGTVLYIGSSGNIRTRWGIHHRYHQFAAHVGVRIAWILVEQIAPRCALEYQCIANFHPLYQQGDIPVRQDKHGKRQWRISVAMPENVYKQLQEACADYHHSMPSLVIFILKRLIQSGQLDKWVKHPHEPSWKGTARSVRRGPDTQLPLFS